MAIAAGKGDFSNVKKYLDRGASPDSFGVDCVETALTSAIKSDKNEIVKFLLEKGANPNLKNLEQNFPLKIALEGNNKEIIDMLTQKGALK